ncbi:MAG TPA: thioesterase family protein [Burkholderiales bacterium]|nr:thioesterase family protein [Burkholderiales bacterium]
MTPSDIAHAVDSIRYSGFVVLPAYIDPNGHMNIGYYSVLFDKALDLPFEMLGLGSASIEQTGRSSFALESHVTYQREVREDDTLDFTFQLLDFDEKRMHYFMTMLHARERWLAATSESISICIDMTTRRSTTWPDDRFARLRALHEAHARRPRPAEIGRVIGIRRSF